GDCPHCPQTREAADLTPTQPSHRPRGKSRDPRGRRGRQALCHCHRTAQGRLGKNHVHPHNRGIGGHPRSLQPAHPHHRFRLAVFPVEVVPPDGAVTNRQRHDPPSSPPRLQPL